MHLTGYNIVVNEYTPCDHISLEECLVVAEKLGLADEFYFEDSTSYPPNCYVYDGDSVYFNNASLPANDYDCYYYETCVCQRG